MDKFQEWHKLLKLIQEETESLSRPTGRKEIETNWQKNCSSPVGFTAKFCQVFKGRFPQILEKYFQIIKERERMQ